MKKQQISRRNFIRSSAAAGAGIAFAPTFLEGLFAKTFGTAVNAPTITQLISACGLCDSACGLRATLKDGVLAFVEGMPEDIQGGGKMCGKGKSAAGFLYDPDRLKYPMKRTNPVKGIGIDPGWQRITWEEALDTTAAKLNETIDRSGADSVLVLARGANDVFMRYVNSIGTPNRIDHIDECFLSDKIVSGKVLGGKLWGHDFGNSKYMLVFGWDLVGKAKIAYTRQVVKAKKNGAKLVLFNPIPGVDAIYPVTYPPKNGLWVDGRDRHPFIKPAGNGMFSTLADGMKKNPGKIQMAIIWKYTTMGFPNPPEIAAELAKVPFTVAIDVWPNETLDLADIIMPEATYLEQGGIAVREHYAIYPQAFVRQAVTAPMFESKGLGWISIELGKRSFPDRFKKPDGTFFNANEVLEEKVKRSGVAASYAEFKQKGVFTKEAPFVPKTQFPTADGKIQLYVKDFKDKGFDALPNWMPKRDIPSSEYPLYLITFIPNVHIRNTTQNNSYLNEIFGTNFVLMHPKTARRHDIEEGDLVSVQSRAGAITLPARVSGGIREDCVCVPHGFGHRSRQLSRAFGKGERDSDLVPSQSMDEILARHDVGGAGAIMDAVVRIERTA